MQHYQAACTTLAEQWHWSSLGCRDCRLFDLKSIYSQIPDSITSKQLYTYEHDTHFDTSSWKFNWFYWILALVIKSALEPISVKEIKLSPSSTTYLRYFFPLLELILEFFVFIFLRVYHWEVYERPLRSFISVVPYCSAPFTQYGFHRGSDTLLRPAQTSPSNVTHLKISITNITNKLMAMGVHVFSSLKLGTWEWYLIQYSIFYT